MSAVTTSGSFLRRDRDFPVLVLSQDYELFFQQSGSISKCLFEPSDMLLDFADRSGMRITFFVDAGMLSRMRELSAANPTLAKDLSSVQRHIESLYARGHEIGLHIHPHWEDTRWGNDGWEFGNTRYQLRDFGADEVSSIVHRYAGELNALCDGSVSSYRAGGFCIDPFAVLGASLQEIGVTTDSSVVPGSVLKDPDKGFNFAAVPKRSWWRFSESPLLADDDGPFLEIPITPLTLPPLYYWGRALDRLRGRLAGGVVGDGMSKALGRREILRRLMGAGRVSELSIDVAKAERLTSRRVLREPRNIWQIMGHPKLLGQASLDALKNFSERKNIRRFETISGLAAAIRAGELSERCE